jgi:hypothetical protein
VTRNGAMDRVLVFPLMAHVLVQALILMKI